MCGIFDGHSVHNLATGRMHAEKAAKHLSRDVWRRTKGLLLDRRVVLEKNAALAAFVSASFTEYQKQCEAKYKRNVVKELMAEKTRIEQEIGEEVRIAEAGYPTRTH